MSSESVQPDVESRTLRAATEPISVIEEARSMFSVTTESGSEYETASELRDALDRLEEVSR